MSAAIGGFVHVEKFTTFTSDIDLTAELPSGKRFPEGARALYVKTAGATIEVTFASGARVSFAHTTDESYLEPKPAKYIAIGEATDAGELWVGF